MDRYVYNPSAKLVARVRAESYYPCLWPHCNGRHLDLDLLDGQPLYDGCCPLFWNRITKREAMDMVTAGTPVTLAREGDCQEHGGAYLVQECGCGGDDCRR